MSADGQSPRVTGFCPGCGANVALPEEPLDPGLPPTFCTSCGTEVPDYRLEPFTPAAGACEPAPSTGPTPLEHRRYSRGGLFRSLGGLLADHAENAVESAKERFGE